MSQTPGTDRAIARLAAARFVPVVRADSPERAVMAGRALAAGGCRLIEVALTTPGASEAIHALVAEGLVVGAGTVLDDELAADAVVAGASFLVSPVLDLHVLDFARSADVLAVPGALTPSEVWAAHRAGARVIKIFPVAAMGGPRYLKLLGDPLPGLQFFPTGGVTLADAAAYLAAGALAVGVSSALLSAEALASDDSGAIAASANRWVNALVGPSHFA